MLKVGALIEVDVEKISFGGESIAYYENIVVFIPMSVPGDRLKVEVISTKKTYCRALIKEIIKPSVDRVEDITKITFEDFYGCDFAMIKYPKQLEYKKSITIDVLKKIAKLENVNVFDTIGGEKEYNYRNKIIEPFGKKDGKIITGFYQKKSHDIFETKENWLQGIEVQNLLRTLKEELNKQKLSVYNEKSRVGLLRQVMVRKNTLGHMMLVIVINGLANSKLKFALKKTLEKHNKIKSIYISINNSKGSFALGRENELFYGDEYIKEELFGINFNISPLSFFQINIEQTKKLYSKAIDYFDNIENNIIVDAYSGTGTIAMLLAQRAKKVYGIEVVKSATKDAIKGANANNIKNVEFINGKVEDKLEFLLEKGEKVDGIIFDPPRKGIEESVLKAVAKKEIKNLVYISCNLATFARDMKILTEHSYVLDKLQPIDMFPQTHHIELVAKISLNKEKIC